MRGEPVAAEATMTLQQPEARRVLSRGSCPWTMGPWQWRATQSPGRGGVDSDLCSHTSFLVAAAAASAFHASEEASQCVETFPPSQLPPRGAGLIPILLSRFFFFLLPYPRTWGVSCLLGSLRSSASVLQVFCRSFSTCRCIFYVFVGRKVISTTYPSTILEVPLYTGS